MTTPLPCPVAALKANDLSLLAPEPGVRGCWPPSAALRGEREEFQRDVVRITEGQRRAVSSVDETAVGDTESVEPGRPGLEFTSAITGEGQVIQADPALVEGKAVSRIGKLDKSDESLASHQRDSAPERTGISVQDHLGAEEPLVPHGTAVQIADGQSHMSDGQGCGHTSLLIGPTRDHP